MTNIKILFISMFFLVGMSKAIAQPVADDINKTDAKGLKQGLWRTFKKNGKVLSEGTYKNNLPNGIFKYYHFEKDTLRAVLNFAIDGKTADAVLFAENGKKIAEGKYFDKKKTGLWKFYNEESGLLLSDETYDHGIKTGLWKTYYPTGKVIEELTYKNNRREGPWKQFYENGVVETSANFKNDTICGRASYYYPTGKTRVTGEYNTHGLKKGIWFVYDEKGIVKEQVKYVNGKAVGKKADPVKVEEKPIKVETPDGVKE